MIAPLEGFRFIAFILIFLHHLSFEGLLGVIGVSFFFALSGFLYGSSYFEHFNTLSYNHVYKFYYKRLIRLYPIYFLASILAIPVAIKSNFKDTLSYFIMAQSFYNNGKQVFAYNSVSWFVSTLFFIILMLPFLFYIFNKLKLFDYLICIISLSVLLYIFGYLVAYQFKGEMQPYSFGWWFIYISPYFRILDFLIGAFSGIFFKKINLKIKTKNGIKTLLIFTLLEIATVIVFIVSYKTDWFKFDSILMSIYFLPEISFFLIIFSYSKGLLSGILSNPFTIYFGKISYTAFLLHQIIIRYISLYFEPSSYLYFSTDYKHIFTQFCILISILCISDVIYRIYGKPISKFFLKRNRSYSTT